MGHLLCLLMRNPIHRNLNDWLKTHGKYHVFQKSFAQVINILFHPEKLDLSTWFICKSLSISLQFLKINWLLLETRNYVKKIIQSWFSLCISFHYSALKLMRNPIMSESPLSRAASEAEMILSRQFATFILYKNFQEYLAFAYAPYTSVYAIKLHHFTI